MANPVRIYVLHHPKSELGRKLTDRIYDWFRLLNLEGIPVYVRSANEPGGLHPPMPAGGALEYLVPLVDAEMVRDPAWHDYLMKLVPEPPDPLQPPPLNVSVFFPVALDGTAFNLPDAISRLNFVRHGLSQAALQGLLEASSLKLEEKQLVRDGKDGGKFKADMEAEETLKHLTAALARDLNQRVFPGETTDARFKIFISYARADGVQVPKALRDYIQSQTQCLVFFDENDIGFGRAFEKELEGNVTNFAWAMIVVNGDNYADRPWCRWEIQNFTKARPLKMAVKPQKPDIQVFQPVLVVNTMEGEMMTRVVPELAQMPAIRWAPGHEKKIFSVLMREVLFGLRNVMRARQLLEDPMPDLPIGVNDVVVNRLPGPIALSTLLKFKDWDGEEQDNEHLTLYHPGNGLPLVELRLLKRTFRNIRFKAFEDLDATKSLDATKRMPDKMKGDMHKAMRWKKQGGAGSLSDKIIGISTARSKDLPGLGYLEQHRDEALTHLLRPLVRLGVNLLYGGRLPTRDADADIPPGERSSNTTLMLLKLLTDEQRDGELETGDNNGHPKQRPMLFNMPAWPGNLEIKPADEADWINTCRVHLVNPENVDLPPWQKATAKAGPSFLRYQALTLSGMRKLLAKGFECPLPGKPGHRVKASAWIFIGGAMKDFKGVMPGLMEEFLAMASENPDLPIYLMGGLGGATRVMADVLSQKIVERPAELSLEYYHAQKDEPRRGFDDVMEALSAVELRKVKRQFDDLWKLLKKKRDQGLENLFGNGLTAAENQSLLTTTDTNKAVSLIWMGLSRRWLDEPWPTGAPAKASKARTVKKAKAATSNRAGLSRVVKKQAKRQAARKRSAQA